jgi:hypothetical protein
MSKIEDKVIDKLMDLQDVSFDIKKRISSKIDGRTRVGYVKYGLTLERTDLTKREWVEHLKEEVMDASGYAQRLLEDYPNDRLLEEIVRLNIAMLISLEQFIDEHNLHE